MSEKQENRLRYVREDSSPISGKGLTDFGIRLMELMARRGMRVDDVAATCDLSAARIEKLCRSELSAPDLAVVRMLSIGLLYPVSYFSPATDIDEATARDEEVYLDWLKMRRVELQEGNENE